MLRTRDLPPLRLSILATTPDGASQRWGWDDPNPLFLPKDIKFSTVMPGGFENFSCTLERNPRRSYVDLEPLSDIKVLGVGGGVAWQGRLEKLPDAGGFESQVTPEAVGWQAHLDDNAAAREIYVDQELSRWQGGSATRRLEIFNALGDSMEAPSVGPGPELPALIFSIPGNQEKRVVCFAEYDPKGIPLFSVVLYWKMREKEKIGDLPYSDFSMDIYLGDNEYVAGGHFDESGALLSAGPTAGGFVHASTATRKWVEIQYYGGAPPFGTAGVNYELYVPLLAVYGRHGLTERGAFSLTNSTVEGFYGSDIVAHAVGRWAPLLNYSTGPEGTIETSSFIIEQLAFLDPTTASEIIKQANRFELMDWAVWEYRTYYQYERGNRGNRWRAQIGEAQLQETGAQVARLWNGVIVTYTDIAGMSRTVGPPESGAEVETTLLADDSESNPLNELGIKRWAPLKMGTSTQAGAEQIGLRFLEETKRLDRSGQATLVGYVEDASGTYWPSWRVRAGDEVSFVDAADPSYRRIVHTEYDDNTKSNVIQLDTPAEGLQAVLERLSVVLIPLGLS